MPHVVRTSRRAVLLAFALFATSGTALAASDDTITQQVRIRLAGDAQLKDARLAVSVLNGVVRLTGTVRTSAAIARATKLAHVKGVRAVQNQLTISQ